MRRFSDLAPVLLMVAAGGCAQDEAQHDAGVVAAPIVTLASGGATAALRPAVRVAGRWRGGGQDGPCAATRSGGVTCPTGEGAGAVFAERNGARVRLHAERAGAEADLEAALAATGDVEVLRRGTELSWWYTAVGGGPETFAAAGVDLDVWPA